MRRLALSLAIGATLAGSAVAEEAGCGPAGCERVQTCGSESCCARCGRHGCCHKFCTLVCDTKEIKKVVWDVKCEEFCPMFPGCPGGGPCDKSGAGGDCCKSCDPCAVEYAKKQVPPKCGQVHTRKIPVKKEVICKVPTYRCVVQYLCASCCQSAPPAAENAPPKLAPLPPQPSTPPPPPPR